MQTHEIKIHGMLIHEIQEPETIGIREIHKIKILINKI